SARARTGSGAAATPTRRRAGWPSGTAGSSAGRWSRRPASATTTARCSTTRSVPRPCSGLASPTRRGDNRPLPRDQPDALFGDSPMRSIATTFAALAWSGATHAEGPFPYTTNSIGMTLAKIPAGEFIMGNRHSLDELAKAFPAYEAKRIDDLTD